MEMERRKIERTRKGKHRSMRKRLPRASTLEVVKRVPSKFKVPSTKKPVRTVESLMSPKPASLSICGP